MCDIDQANSSSFPDNNFHRFLNLQSIATRHPFQLNGKNYRVRHIFCRRTPPPPELNLPLIDFLELYIFFVDLGPFPVSWTVVLRLIELEVKLLKILKISLMGLSQKFLPSDLSKILSKKFYMPVRKIFKFRVCFLEVQLDKVGKNR